MHARARAVLRAYNDEGDADGYHITVSADEFNLSRVHANTAQCSLARIIKEEMIIKNDGRATL